MKNYMNRLDRVKEAIIPKNKFALCFVRYGLESEDFQKQCQEYESFYGGSESVTFVSVTNYHRADDEGYEGFLERCRRKSSGTLCWWPALPPLDEE